MVARHDLRLEGRASKVEGNEENGLLIGNIIILTLIKPVERKTIKESLN